jgi:hypothetical protein
MEMSLFRLFRAGILWLVFILLLVSLTGLGLVFIMGFLACLVRLALFHLFRAGIL